MSSGVPELAIDLETRKRVALQLLGGLDESPERPGVLLDKLGGRDGAAGAQLRGQRNIGHLLLPHQQLVTTAPLHGPSRLYGVSSGLPSGQIKICSFGNRYRYTNVLDISDGCLK